LAKINNEYYDLTNLYYDYYGKLDLKGTLEELNNHVGEDGIIRTDQIFDDIF